MITLGLRVGTTDINYVVYSGTFAQPKLITNDKLRQPVSYDLPQALSYYRNQIIAICKEYKVNTCGIRIAEPVSRRNGCNEGSIKRANIEGVMMETCSSLAIDLTVGVNATFSPVFNVKAIKELIDSKEFNGITQWGKLNKEFKEASIASLAALKLRA